MAVLKVKKKKKIYGEDWLYQNDRRISGVDRLTPAAQSFKPDEEIDVTKND